MTVAFGDVEPEDGWDRGDPPAELLDNLRRRAVLLYVVAPRLDTLGDVALAVIVARARPDLTPRDALRVVELLDDIVYTAGRGA